MAMSQQPKIAHPDGVSAMNPTAAQNAIPLRDNAITTSGEKALDSR